MSHNYTVPSQARVSYNTVGDGYDGSSQTFPAGFQEMPMGNERKEGFVKEVGLGEVEEREDIVVSKWGIGWMTSAVIFGLYFIAIIIATIHYVLFWYLNGRRVDIDTKLPQSWVTTISVALTTAFKTALCASLGTAFLQHLWHVLRWRALRVIDIDRLYVMRTDPLALLYPRTFQAAPLLYLLAIFGWLIPIAVIYPPGALTVAQDGFSQVFNATVAGFDAAFVGNTSLYDVKSHALADFSIDTSVWEYASTRSSVLSTSKATLVNGDIANFPSPCGPNCTYTLQFDGPYIQCNRTVVNETLLDSVPRNAYSAAWLNECNQTAACLAQCDETTAACQDACKASAEIAAHPEASVSGWCNINNQIQDFVMNTSRIWGVLYTGQGFNGFSDVITLTGEPVNFTYFQETEMLRCRPGRATYDVKTTYQNNERTISVKTQSKDYLRDLFNANLSEADPFPSHFNKSTADKTYDIYDKAPLLLSELGHLGNLRAFNLFALTDALVTPLAGNQPMEVDGLGELNNVYNYTLPNGTVIPVLPMSQVYSPAGAGVIFKPNNTIITTTRFNDKRFNYSPNFNVADSSSPSISLSEAQLNDALRNITLSVATTFGWWPEPAAANETTFSQTYHFAHPINLLLPYTLCLLLALPFLVIGWLSLRRNGVPASDGGFLQTLMTTTASERLRHAAAGGCLGGEDNIPTMMRVMRVRFGEVDMKDGSIDWDDTVRRAGFGVEGEVKELRRDEAYGARRSKRI